VPALPALGRTVLSSTEKNAIRRDIIEVAQRDYLHLLRTIAKEEIEYQKEIGNPPTAMLVDNRAGTHVEEATRSVRVWFADRKSLADAAFAARNALQLNGRRVTGRTLFVGLRHYYSVGAGGELQQISDPRSIALSFPNPAALDLYVAIPLAHVRAWQWLNASGRRAKRRTRNKQLLRWAKASKTKAQRVSASVFEKSAKQVQRMYPNLDVKDVYLQVPDLNTRGRTPVDRIPAIKVCLKIRGRGR